MIEPDRPLASVVPSVGMAGSLRAAIAGGEAARLLASSVRLFEVGGKHVLSASVQKAVRGAAERGARGAIAVATGPVLGSASGLAMRIGGATSAVSSGAKATRGAGVAIAMGAGKQAMRAASKEILKGAGKAAGLGFLLDGAVAGFEAVIAVRNGSSSARAAMKYVATEATTGALATGAGVLLGASLVALTGGVAAPVVFAVGALGSIGTKGLLRRIVRA